MGKHNHVKRLTGRVYNFLPKSLKPHLKKVIKGAPGQVERGKKKVSGVVDSIVYGKKRK